MAANEDTGVKRRRGRRIALVIVLLFCLVLALALVAAPFLPRLISEGFPAQRWPAAGTHVTVAGDNTVPQPLSATTTDIKERSKVLFEERGGAALLIWQGGALRGQHFSSGTGPDTRFNSFSMVKSLVGALVLRAHADGLIADLADPIGTYLPELGDETFRNVPIARFLTMRSGVALETVDTKSEDELKPVEEYGLNPFSPLARLHMEGLEPLAAELRADASAIGQYNYQNVNTAILGRLLSTLYDKPLEQILSERIWRPSGAADALWRAPGPNKPVTAYCCLYATAGDWIKVAVFLMRNGTASEPFLPQRLWQAFFGSSIPDTQRRSGHYGMHVFQNILDREGEKLQGPFTYMMGQGGQTTYMMPQHDLVVVRFGDGYPLLHSTLYGASDSLNP